VRTFFEKERDLQKSIKKQLVAVRTSLATGVDQTSDKKPAENTERNILNKEA
jgi:hypothetical protein